MSVHGLMHMWWHGGKARCKNHWCEFPKVVGGKREMGRGKLMREIEGSLPTMSGKGGGITVNHACIGLCKATLGSNERRGPCPELAAKDIIMPEECKCNWRVAANTKERRRHKQKCMARGDVLADGWEEEVIQCTRNRIAGDAQKRRCIVPSCQETVVGIRGLYLHMVNSHWDKLQANRRLAVAAHVSIGRMEGGGPKDRGQKCSKFARGAPRGS